MRKIKITFCFLAVALALSGCGIFGSSDGTDVSVAENVEAQPTVNNVQSVPAETVDPLAAPADAALPTAVTLPTTAPTPEPTVDRSQPTTYIVQSGDVLGLIAERFDADIAELRRVNNLDGNLIRVGQELTIPALDGSTTTTTTETGGSASGSAAAPAPAATRAPAATVSCSNAGSGHCIQPGDSLAGIAFKYSVTVDALRAANPGVAGDLILSGQVLILPGSGTTTPVNPTNPSAPTSIVPAGTPSPAVTAGPSDDAACAARNPQFPYFHAADGLCYANPIGSTSVPTSVASEGADTKCPAGRFLWDDGLCYPIPGVTVTPTAGPTSTGSGVLPDYGTAPCRDGYLPLEGGRCWPAPDTTPATVVPVSQATPTTTAASTTECVEPNFFLNGTSCFLLPDGAAKGCTLDGNTPRCPAT